MNLIPRIFCILKVLSINCLLLTVYCLLPSATAQQISDITVTQEEKKIIISYNLADKEGINDYHIKLYVSTDGGSTWDQITTGLSGAVGEKITAGNGKIIIWEVVPSRYRMQFDNLKFKITVTYYGTMSYTETYAGLNIEMIWIDGGEYWMGCTPEGDSDCDTDEHPRHKVKLKGFWMGKSEVTNAQFCKFLNERGNQTEGGVEWINLDGSYDDEKCRIYKSGNSFYVESGYENYPVIYVSWYGAKAFCEWLSEKTGKKYRLPSEAQWEYAARSRGKEYKYAWGNGNPTKGNGGNLADETLKKRYNWTILEGYTDGYIHTSPVCSFGTNELGLCDMSGNVWEWCEDNWYGNYKGAPSDGSARIFDFSMYHVVRGGSSSSSLSYVRCSNRFFFSPDGRNSNYGFRLLRMQ